jgi:hypothetical protein
VTPALLISMVLFFAFLPLTIRLVADFGDWLERRFPGVGKKAQR